MAILAGINVGGPITPGGDDTNTFPTHYDIYGQGGLMVVSSLTALSGISTLRQKAGMVVYSADTSLYYAVTSLSYPLTGYTPILSLSGSLGTSIPTISSNNWNTAYSNAIYTVNGTANQIAVANSGGVGSKAVTLSLPDPVIFPGTFNVKNLSATNVIYTSALNITSGPVTFTNPVTASGTFLIVNINGTNKAIQLWNYTS